MSTTIPDSHRDLIEGPIYCVLTTISPSGAPENTVVWCSWYGTYILVNTVEGRRKAKNVSANPKVALTAIDPRDAFRWIDVRGTVEKIVEDKDHSNINFHSKLYAGKDEYYGGFVRAELKGTEKRIILKIRPERVFAFPPESEKNRLL